MTVYTRTWPQLRPGRAKPGSTIGRVSEVIAHTEGGFDLPASATVAQEVERFRAIDTYHRSIGWSGFGYSAMVCQSGRIYEGRGYGRSGAHTQGRNSTALAFVVPGHGDRTAMSPACIEAARRWIAAGIDGGHITTKPKVSGHRDYAAKSCPGNRIYPQLSRLAGVAGTPQEDPMAKLSEEAQEFYEAQYRALAKNDADPTSAAWLLAGYRAARLALGAVAPGLFPRPKL